MCELSLHCSLSLPPNLPPNFSTLLSPVSPQGGFDEKNELKDTPLLKVADSLYRSVPVEHDEASGAVNDYNGVQQNKYMHALNASRVEMAQLTDQLAQMQCKNDELEQNCKQSQEHLQSQLLHVKCLEGQLASKDQQTARVKEENQQLLCQLSSQVHQLHEMKLLKQQHDLIAENQMMKIMQLKNELEKSAKDNEALMTALAAKEAGLCVVYEENNDLVLRCKQLCSESNRHFTNFEMIMQQNQLLQEEHETSCEKWEEERNEQVMKMTTIQEHLDVALALFEMQSYRIDDLESKNRNLHGKLKILSTEQLSEDVKVPVSTEYR